VSDDLWPTPVDEPATALAPRLPRALLVQQAVFWDAVAEQAAARAADQRRLLFEQAREEFEQERIAPTWRIPGLGTVPLALSADRVDVADEAVYTAWVAERHPEQIETIVRVRPAFDNVLRKGAAKRGAACTAEGDVIPGLLFVPGGLPKSIAIRASEAAKGDAAELAVVVLDGLLEARPAPAALSDGTP
jgi:hypothetical protein